MIETLCLSWTLQLSLRGIFLQSIRFRRGGLALPILQPKVISNFEWIDIALLPPLPFFACGVDVVVVDGAERNGELIAHLQAQALEIGRSGRDEREREIVRRSDKAGLRQSVDAPCNECASAR